MTEKTNAKGLAGQKTFARRIASLLRRRPIRQLASASQRLGQPAWIVGGAVRDLWLHRPIGDVDIAVAGDPEALARELSKRGAGSCVPLSAEPPRVFRLAGKGIELDLAEIERGSIERDLGRRDFTANAIALSLPGGEPLDPFGGLADLSRRRLRAVHADNFEEDPLRALRAARFLATHGLRADARTRRICRLAAPGLSGVAPERIRAELARLLEAPRAAPALAWAAAAHVLGPALGRPLLEASRRGLGRAAATFDAAAIRALPADGRRRARLALLSAVLGLATRETSRWLSARRWSREDAGGAARLRALAEAAGEIRSTQAQWRWIREAGDGAREALAVIPPLAPSGAAVARRLARRLASARPLPGGTVKGSDVMAWLGLAPGPAIGKLLSEIEIAGLSGRVRSRREARKWLEANAPAIIRSS
jgi:tRNA nucleotidyltransferase/poly(A) polymerase